MVLRCGASVSSGESSTFGADDSDACGCRVPLEGVVVVSLPASGLRVKTLVCMIGLGSANDWHREPPGSIVVKLRCLWMGLA